MVITGKMEKRKKWMWVLLGVGITILLMSTVFMVGVKYEKLNFDRVVDGDTFWVKDFRDGSEWKVRLWGVDAPTEGECYFDESTKLLEEKIQGKKLTFVRKGYDGFGRILAKVYVDGDSLEEILLEAGAAKVYDANKVHDDLKPSAGYIQRLKKVEEKAKNESVGVWSEECFK